MEADVPIVGFLLIFFSLPVIIPLGLLIGYLWKHRRKLIEELRK